MLLNKAPKFGNDVEEVDEYSYWAQDTLDTCMQNSITMHKAGRSQYWLQHRRTNGEMGKWV